MKFMQRIKEKRQQNIEQLLSNITAKVGEEAAQETAVLLRQNRSDRAYLTCLKDLKYYLDRNLPLYLAIALVETGSR